jgi:hypothetical protein
MAKEKPLADGGVPQKPSMFQNLAAVIGGIIAVRIATYIVTTMWRLVTREEPPQIDQAVPIPKKAAWIALTGAAAGAARQSIRDIIKPPTSGAA